MPLKPMYPANNPVTVQLAQDLSSTDSDIAVTHVSLFPPPPNFVTVGTEANAETILYTGIDVEEGKLTGCQRGRLGTTAADWPAGEFIYHAWSPDNANILMENILILAEEKASAQELQRMDETLEVLESSVQSLNAGKANLSVVEELSQTLDTLSLRLDNVEEWKADVSEIQRIDAAITALENAIAGLGGDGELDPSDIARLEAAIVSINQTLATKADASHIARIDGELAALSAALEGKVSVDALATKADASHIARIDGELANLSVALEDKASASQVAALTPRIYSVQLTAQGWSQDEDGFRHPVFLPVVDGEQADFSAPMPVLHQLAQKGILVCFENHDGVLSAVASGQPDFDFTAQATVYKVVPAL